MGTPRRGRSCYPLNEPAAGASINLPQNMSADWSADCNPRWSPNLRGNLPCRRGSAQRWRQTALEDRPVHRRAQPWAVRVRLSRVGARRSPNGPRNLSRRKLAYNTARFLTGTKICAISCRGVDLKKTEKLVGKSSTYTCTRLSQTCAGYKLTRSIWFFLSWMKGIL